MNKGLRNRLVQVAEDRDSYPVTNVRWGIGVAFFVLPLVVVAARDSVSVWGVVGAGSLGVGFVLVMSLLKYGMDFHEERVGARVLLSACLALIVTGVVGLVGVGLLALVSVVSPVAGVVLVFGVVFTVLFVWVL